MRTFSLSDLNRQSGEVVDAALVAPVSLTKRGKPKLVVLNVETYELLAHGKSFRIEDAPEPINALVVEALDDILVGH